MTRRQGKTGSRPQRRESRHTAASWRKALRRKRRDGQRPRTIEAITSQARERLPTKPFHIEWRKDFMTTTELNSTLKHILHAIQEYMSPEKPFAWPSQRRLAEDCSFNRTTVSSYLAPRDPPAPVVPAGHNQGKRAWLVVGRDDSLSTNIYVAAIPGIGTAEDWEAQADKKPSREEGDLPF